MSAYLVSLNDTLAELTLLASSFLILLDIFLLDITGVSLPYSSTNTIPSWYSLSDLTDLDTCPVLLLVNPKSIFGK